MNTETSKAPVSETDFYQILELSRQATFAEIKQQYRKLSLYYHPDKKTGDEAKYAQINMAFKVLSNDKKRKKYDDSLASTFDELTSVKRDLEYHRNDDFITENNHGEHVFDQKKFSDVFQAQNVTLDQGYKPDDSKLEDLLAARVAERDNLTYQIHDNTKNTVTGFRQMDSSEFNQTFNLTFEDLRKHNRELVESNIGLDDAVGFVPSSGLEDDASRQCPDATGLIVGGSILNLTDQHFQNSEIEKSLRRLQEGAVAPNDDWQRKTPEQLLQDRMRAYQAETQELWTLQEDDYIVEQNTDVLSYQEVSNIDVGAVE